MDEHPNKASEVSADRLSHNTPRLSTAELFRGRSRIEIEHKGETYRLQITRQGKLILTK